MRVRHILTAAAVILLTLRTVTAAVSGGSPQLGDWTINNYVKFVTRFGVNKVSADLSGPKLNIHSSEYDMAAPHITMTAQKPSVKEPYKVTHADAAGGVTIIMRQPAASRT